jgi:MFS family permease
MVMAAGESGCNPLATGIMSDIFPENKRALVMAIFNWGVYGEKFKKTVKIFKI